ncbi:hypothetical protein F5887DRAFT_170335 [Amanita rubescens]|nr:hypothetical protein F5887DRAFT_170335 [Amanita rubescens]
MNTNPTFHPSDSSPGTWSTPDAGALSSDFLDFLELFITFNDSATSSTPPAIRGDGPVTGTPLGVLADFEIQATNSKKPSFRRETSEVDGSLVYRCECGRAIKRKGDLRRHWSSRGHRGRGFDGLKCGTSLYMLNRHVSSCRAKPATTQTFEAMVKT